MGVPAFIPRDYQHAAINYLWQAFAERSGHINPLMVLPVGTGKASLLGMICRDVYANWPGTGRIIVLTHSKELVEQDAKSIKWVWPTASVSVYSAGLKQKDITGRIIVAGIQSFANIAHEVDAPSIVLIDEAHMIPANDETLYKQTLAILREKNPKLVCIGLTATPWRMKGGHLLNCGLFNHMACDFGSRETFVRFITEGYLARLITKATDAGFDLSEVGTVAGDYNQKQLGIAVQANGATQACVREMIEKGQSRKKWLIFAASVQHAELIAELLNDSGIRTGVVHSKMKGNRDDVIKEFKTGNMRALVNMGVLTTGFDFPQIDLIALMRPTKSISLHIQILGRGTRPVFAPGYDVTTVAGRLSAIAAGSKPDGCLVLDFAANIMRLGPINDPILPDKKKKRGGDAPPMKVCPDCKSQWASRVAVCTDCGYEFPPPALEISAGASEQAAIAGIGEDAPSALDIRDLEVTAVNYALYQKPGKPPCIRAVYHCGLINYNGWLCFEHKGSAQGLARKWWKANVGNENYPTTCEEFLVRKAELQKPVAIRVWVKKPYPEILTPLYQDDEINFYDPQA
jgi:DNA repair protein RadD